MAAIVSDVVNRMEESWLYIIGPGTKTRMITSRLELDKTLIRVDVVTGRELIATDVNKSQLGGRNLLGMYSSCWLLARNRKKL